MAQMARKIVHVLTQILAQPDLRGNRPRDWIIIDQQLVQFLQVPNLRPERARESYVPGDFALLLLKHNRGIVWVGHVDHVAPRGILEPQLLELLEVVNFAGDDAGHPVLVHAQVLEVLHPPNLAGDVELEVIHAEVDLAALFELPNSVGDQAAEHVFLRTEEHCAKLMLGRKKYVCKRYISDSSMTKCSISAVNILFCRSFTGCRWSTSTAPLILLVSRSQLWTLMPNIHSAITYTHTQKELYALT